MTADTPDTDPAALGPQPETALREALRHIWDSGYAPMYNGRPSCPFCLNFVDDEETHRPDCALRSALRVALSRQPEPQAPVDVELFVDGETVVGAAAYTEAGALALIMGAEPREPQPRPEAAPTREQVEQAYIDGSVAGSPIDRDGEPVALVPVVNVERLRALLGSFASRAFNERDECRWCGVEIEWDHTATCPVPAALDALGLPLEVEGTLRRVIQAEPECTCESEFPATCGPECVCWHHVYSWYANPHGSDPDELAEAALRVSREDTR